MMVGKAEEVFAEELAKIKDTDIKDFVIDVFDTMVPDYFWTEQCSSTGKYHPRWNQGKGGIVRHIKVATFYAAEFTRAMPLEREEVMRSGFGTDLYTDIVIAATLLHDGIKHGPEYDGTKASMPKDNCESHGYVFAQYIYEKKFAPRGSCPLKFKAILRGISGHMGIWTGKPMYKPHLQKDSVIRKICECVFYGDYVSSRKPTKQIYEIMKEGA